MLSIVVTFLLLIVALFIIVSLLVSAKHMQRRLAHTTGGSASAMSTGLPSSWYIRRRTMLSFAFLVMIALTLFFQDSLTEGTIRTFSGGLNVSLLSYSQSTSIQLTGHTNQTQTTTASLTTPLSASARVIRVDSAARTQYYNDYQWKVWSYSSCSGIAMETVMNAYGRHLIAADVLQEELDLGVWDINLGLLREDGIATTAAYFGFNTDATHTRSLQELVMISNRGAPVIVSVRDSYYFPGGHIFVIYGGDGQNVYIADSSPANFQRMSYTMFLGMWQGFSAVLTPR